MCVCVCIGKAIIGAAKKVFKTNNEPGYLQMNHGGNQTHDNEDSNAGNHV